MFLAPHAPESVPPIPARHMHSPPWCDARLAQPPARGSPECGPLAANRRHAPARAVGLAIERKGERDSQAVNVRATLSLTLPPILPEHGLVQEPICLPPAPNLFGENLSFLCRGAAGCDPSARAYNFRE